MFDPDIIIQDITVQMGRYFSSTLKRLFDSDVLPTPILDSDSWQHAIQHNTTLDDTIRLLVRIANGDIPGDLADDVMLDEVEEAIQSVLRTLFSPPGHPRYYAIPPQFWNTPLGQVIRHCQVWLHGDDLISYSEAAGMLWPDDDIHAARMRIKRMVERGELAAYVDPAEANPQRAARVSREETEAYKA